MSVIGRHKRLVVALVLVLLIAGVLDLLIEMQIGRDKRMEMPGGQSPGNAATTSAPSSQAS